MDPASRFEISQERTLQNLALLRKPFKKQLEKGLVRTRVMVKANAYGHGVQNLAAILEKHVEEFGVASLDEALELRKHLRSAKPIFIFNVFEDEIDLEFLNQCEQFSLTPVLESYDAYVKFSRFDSKREFEIEIDTGMGRAGWDPQIFSSLSDEEVQKFAFRCRGLLSHAPLADEIHEAFTLKQQKTFLELVRDYLTKAKDRIPPDFSYHFDNSAGVMRGLKSDLDLQGAEVLRPGLMLYGASPFQKDFNEPGFENLQEIGRWTTRVHGVRRLRKGDRVGYGSTYIAPRERKLAVIRVGYADGYSRAFSNRSEVLIHGKRFPVVGRVSMDLTTVLVDESVDVGDEVVLLGDQKGKLGDGRIRAWELATLCDTIPYEVWTRIGSRVKRSVI